MPPLLLNAAFAESPLTKTVTSLAWLAALLSFTSTAEACGGLFCSSANPVNQAAERIIFAKNDNGTVTAAIEISYAGDAEKFAWVLPVPPGDEVTPGIASKISFDRLDAMSSPTYQLSTQFDPDCAQADFAGGATGATGGASGPSGPTGPGGSVSVVASGNVGPYDWVQIEIDSAAEDPVQDAIDWLTDGGYDVAQTDPDTLRPYLDQEMNLIAFKLTKADDAGSIRPITITYPAEQPFIPIRPTAVAANDDMGVKVWVLGESRAVPQNQYYSLELNQTLINWFNPNSNYNDVVIRAANEAGGFGFVTEQSGPAGEFSAAIYSDDEKQSWNRLLNDPNWQFVDFLRTAIQTFGSHDGMDYLLNDSTLVPLREGASANQLLTCVDCYFAVDVPVRNDAYPTTPYDPNTDPIHTMDVSKFLDAMYEYVIAPLENVQALFDGSNNVTRFYTTLSPEEMLVDPSFDFNPDLPSVDNVHRANRVFQCSGDAEWRIEFDNGFVIQGTGSTWPVPDTKDMPANLKLLQVGTKGEGQEVEDNTAEVLRRLQRLGVGSYNTASNADGGTPSGDAGDPTSGLTEQTDNELGSETETSSEETGTRGGADAGAHGNDGAGEGCSCRVVGQREQSRLSWAWCALLGAGWFARRRGDHSRPNVRH